MSELEFRQWRPFLRHAHMGPQNGPDLHKRIGFELDLPAEAALLGLRRDFHTLAGHVVLPAVIRATQTAFLVAPEPKRDAAMGAELVDQAVTAVGIAERNEPLRKKLHPHGWTFVLGQLIGEQRGNPIAAKQKARRGAGPGPGQ